MVRALHSGASALGWSPGLVFLAGRHFTFMVSLPTKVYKWVPASLMLGGGSNPAKD